MCVWQAKIKGNLLTYFAQVRSQGLKKAAKHCIRYDTLYLSLQFTFMFGVCGTKTPLMRTRAYSSASEVTTLRLYTNVFIIVVVAVAAAVVVVVPPNPCGQ